MKKATSLRQKFLGSLDSSGWFWLRGGSVTDSSKSYLGYAEKIIECESSDTKQFKAELTELWAESKKDVRADSSEVLEGDWVVAFGYEFGREDLSEVTAVAMQVSELYVFEHVDANSRSVKPAENLQLVNEDHFHKPEYLEKLSRVQSAITDGDASVLCLTHSFDFERASVNDPLTSFLRLLENSDTPYLGLIEWDAKALVSASPESFLQLENGIIRTKPIKGTVKRDQNPMVDMLLRERLLESLKERTEISRVISEVVTELKTVCLEDTIETVSQGHIESFKQVYQLVGEIQGELDPNANLWDILDAIFPAASMTGSPRERAIEILADIEAQSRGWYSGAFGFVSADGELVNLAMTIRSLQYDLLRVRVQAGGGITEASELQAEYEEMLLKARAMLEALRF